MCGTEGHGHHTLPPCTGPWTDTVMDTRTPGSLFPPGQSGTKISGKRHVKMRAQSPAPAWPCQKRGAGGGRGGGSRRCCPLVARSLHDTRDTAWPGMLILHRGWWMGPRVAWPGHPLQPPTPGGLCQDARSSPFYLAEPCPGLAEDIRGVQGKAVPLSLVMLSRPTALSHPRMVKHSSSLGINATTPGLSPTRC